MSARACRGYQYPLVPLIKESGDNVEAKFSIINCGNERGNFFIRIMKNGRECDGRFNFYLDPNQLSSTIRCLFTMPTGTVSLRFLAGHAEGGVWKDDYDMSVDIFIKECSTGCEVSCQTVCESSCQSACESSCQSACENSCQTGCEVNCQSACQTACQTDCELGCLSCQLSCQLFCQDACQAACESVCETVCQGACELACQVACETVCQTSYEDTCQAACQTHCETACETACQLACQTTCEETCENVCQIGCQVACESACEKGCEVGCEIMCELLCQSSCEKDCQISCEVRCEDACELSCQASCETACETTCEDTCEASCETPCETGCQTACEITCQLSEEGGETKETRLIVDNIEAIIEEPVGIEAKLQSKNLIWHDLGNAEVHVYLDGELMASKITDSDGKVTIPYTPKVAGNFTIKAVFDGYESTYAPCEETGELSVKGFSVTHTIEDGKVIFNGVCTLKLPRDYVRLYRPDFGVDTVIVDSIPVSQDGLFSCTIPEPTERTSYYVCRCWAQLNICEWTLDCGSGATRTQDVVVIPTIEEDDESIIDVIIGVLVSVLGITDAQAKTILLGAGIILALMLLSSVKGAFK